MRQNLGWAVGYPAAILLMVTIVAVLIVVFKRSGWL